MYNFENVVRYSEVDANRHMTLCALLDLFQDCCTFQSEDLGIGLDYFISEKRVWFLSSWQVVIKRFPKMGEKITAQTWPYDFKGFYGYRNFTLVNEHGEVLAYANSIWIHLNTETMRPTRMSEQLQSVYVLEPAYPMEYCDRKIKLAEGMVEREKVPVQKFHIDTNNHVNNTKYVLMAQEYLPDDFKIGELRVEYKKAAVLSDVIYPKTKVTEECVMVSLESEDGKPYAIVEFMKEK